MFYRGIDIAKRNLEASSIDAEGKPLPDSLSFSGPKDGCVKRLALLERLRIGRETVIIGMDAAGHSWLPVYAHLNEQVCDVRAIHPIQSEAFRKMHMRQAKNGSTASFISAQAMRFGQDSPTTLWDKNIVAMRRLTRFHTALANRCGDCARRIIACRSRRIGGLT